MLVQLRMSGWTPAQCELLRETLVDNPEYTESYELMIRHDQDQILKALRPFYND